MASDYSLPRLQSTSMHKRCPCIALMLTSLMLTSAYHPKHSQPRSKCLRLERFPSDRSVLSCVSRPIPFVLEILMSNFGSLQLAPLLHLQLARTPGLPTPTCPALPYFASTSPSTTLFLHLHDSCPSPHSDYLVPSSCSLDFSHALPRFLATLPCLSAIARAT